MEKRQKHHTVMTPISLPPEFNYTGFIYNLTVFDINLRETLQKLSIAMQNSDEEEIARLVVDKTQRTEAFMKFLEDAYIQTEGRIAELPEFDPQNERSFKLAIEENGQLLWFKIKYRIETMREQQEEMINDILAE